MPKTLAIVLVLAVCASGFDEIDNLPGTISRPGYENLKSVEWVATGAHYLEGYTIENQLSGTPRVKLTQFQSSYSPMEAEKFAVDFIDKHKDVLRLSPQDFALTSSRLILGKTYFISLIQKQNGVPVWGSHFSIKATLEGKVYLYGGETFAGIQVDTEPSFQIERAEVNASTGIGYDSSTDMVSYAGLYVLPLIFDDRIDYHLCHVFEIKTHEPLADWRAFVDAHTGELLWRENTMRYETVYGTVDGWIQLETAYDNPVQQNFPNLHIFGGGDLADTSAADGSFSFEVSGPNPVDMYALLEGAYLDVDNQTGPDAFMSGMATPDSVFNITWDDANSTIPERDAYYHGQVVHDYIKSIDPMLEVMDFQMTCRVNVAGSCNAYWSSYDRSINFYRQGGGCPNIAQIADVVYHEYGHGLTNLQYYYGGHQDPNGAMHEGFSDFIAGLITDQPLIGRSFFGPGSWLRTLDNDNRYPEDWVGEPHEDGLIIGGALWDLKLLLDDERPGYTDTLWHYAKYGYSSEFVGYFWDVVTVDDDDGNIENGTPHAYEIFHSFGDLHGIGPGVTVEISHTPLIDSEDSTAAFPVPASVYSMFSMDSGSVTIYYSTGSGFLTVPMVNTSGDVWYGEIPRQPYGTTVAYYIEAIDGAGMFGRSPEGAPDSVYSFYVGLDTIPPALTFVDGQQNTINLYGPYGPFAFQAWDVHDIDLASARLHYRINGENEIVVPMAAQGDSGLFALDELDLGRMLLTGDVIYYWFTCQDEAIYPNVGRLPSDGSFSAEMATAELVDDFEEGIGDWTIIDPCWVAYDRQGYQSFNSIKTGSEWYENNTNSIVYRTRPFNLTPYPNVWLSFMHLNLLPAGDTCFAVAATDPGGPWSRFSGINGFNAWRRTSPQLVGFGGLEEVYIGFQFISDDTITHAGILVDNVEILIVEPTGIAAEEAILPKQTILSQNYPNPFNAKTTISFTLSQSMPVRLEILDVLGRKVVDLLDDRVEPGRHHVVWDGKNSGGGQVASGIYFYRLQYGDRSTVRQMLLLK